MNLKRIVVSSLFLPVLTMFCAGSAIAAEDGARVIVKYKTNSPLLAKTIASAGRQQLLAGIAGTANVSERALAGRMHLVKADGQSSEQLAAKLAARSDVEYAVPDRRKTIKATPNDTYFSEQWNLLANEAASINAVAAWDQTTGSASTIVAVLDTGIRPEHPDLANKLVPGYDFITSVDNAGDLSARDSDPTDPGDYVTQAEKNANSYFNNCEVSNSSWHGTRVAGIIAAETNNNAWMAGTAWAAKILPVRVLGKCGGYDSDIIPAMLWAAGIPVSGVANNPNPAKILNLSFGGSTACYQAMQDAVNQVVAAGAIVVVAAGNEAVNLTEPADCSGVLAVTGVRHIGTKVGYSSFGANAGIAAPAGNCVNLTGTCLFPITSTGNSGTTVPVASAISSGYGTSFSAPQVAGVAALMMSAAPSISASDAVSKMKLAARPFPSSAALRSCPDVESSGSDAAGQCNCVVGQCGAGILNASKAVRLAKGLPIALITPPSKPVVGVEMTLGSGSSLAGTGSSISSYAWSLVTAGAGVNSIPTTTTPNLLLTASSAGTFTVKLVVTDANNNTDEDTFKVTVEDAVPTARISSPTTATAEQPFQLIGNTSSATSGRSIASYAWTLWNGGGIVTSITNANAAVATVTPSAAGTFSVRLTVTDSVGQSSTVGPFSVTVAAAPAASAPTESSGGGGGGGAIDPYALAAAALLLLLAYGARRVRK